MLDVYQCLRCGGVVVVGGVCGERVGGIVWNRVCKSGVVLCQCDL